MPARILAADIGGTSSRFAAFELGGDGILRLSATNWLKSGEARSFTQLLEQLRATDFPIKPENADICVFAIAGPVERGVYCKPPLLAWDVDLSNAEKDFGIKRCALLNDFLVQAFACRSEIGQNAAPVLPGTPIADAPVAAIGAGTGLGKAVLLPDGHGGFVGGASEGGHTNFPVESSREFEFFKFACERLSEEWPSWNHVVSGRGLSLIHEYLTGEELEPQDVATRLVEGSETLAWCSTFYGRVCRNYALETLCFGGMYIAGGVAAKNPQLVLHARFKEEFYNSSIHRKVLQSIPVFLIDNEESGLWGAGFYGAQELRS